MVIFHLRCSREVESVDLFLAVLLERLLGGGVGGAEALPPEGQAEAQIDCSSALVSPSQGLKAGAPC